MRNNTKEPLYFLLTVSALILLLALAGCRENVELETGNSSIDISEVEDVGELNSADNPPEESTSAVIADTVMPEVNQCLACHTNQQRLTDTAKAVQVKESESSGEG
jgi:hypothetical protein